MWNEALVEELRSAKRQVLGLQGERQAFFEQQMANEVEKASRKAASSNQRSKKKKEVTVEEASSSSKPPPPPPGGASSSRFRPLQ